MSDRCPRICLTCRMSLVRWYSIVAFQCLKVWKWIWSSLGFFSLFAIFLRWREKFLIQQLYVVKNSLNGESLGRSLYGGQIGEGLQKILLCHERPWLAGNAWSEIKNLPISSCRLRLFSPAKSAKSLYESISSMLLSTVKTRPTSGKSSIFVSMPQMDWIWSLIFMASEIFIFVRSPEQDCLRVIECCPDGESIAF